MLEISKMVYSTNTVMVDLNGIPHQSLMCICNISMVEQSLNSHNVRIRPIVLDLCKNRTQNEMSDSDRGSYVFSRPSLASRKCTYV